jgi:hypothetical protein
MTLPLHSVLRAAAPQPTREPANGHESREARHAPSTAHDEQEPDGRATETSALPQLYTVLELAVVFSLVVVAE